MDTEQEEKKAQRAEKFLRIIERTRLLYNTSAELGEVVGFSLESGNGLARKGGRSSFMKDAVLRELIYMTEQRTSLNLERVIEAYIDADRLMLQYRRQLRKKDVCRQLIRHFYAEAEVDESLQEVAAEMGREHVPLLLLMLQDALPSLSAKGGDVQGIGEVYRQVFSMVKSIVCTDIQLRTLPMMTEMEVWANKNPQKLCRIDLIDCVYLILENYGSISTPEQLSSTNVALLSRQFIPDLDGIWTEDEASTVFWQFRKYDNGHSMRRYVLNSERRELSFMDFHLRCFDDGDSIWALVMHPHLIQSIVHQTPTPNDCFANLEMTMDDEDTLTFEPKTTDSQWFHLRNLKRSSREAFFLDILENENYRQLNECPEDEYTFSICLAAITVEALYVQWDEENFLRVPKSLNRQLEDLHFGESTGIIRMNNGPVFLAFDDRRLYYEVTTEKQRRALGTEVVAELCVRC